MSLKNKKFSIFIYVIIAVPILFWSALLASKVANDFSGNTFVSALMGIVVFLISNILLWLVYFLIENALGFLLGVNNVGKNMVKEETPTTSDESNIESTTDLENHETKYDDRKNWLTLRAEYYIKTAIKDKYIKKLGEDNYKWGLSARCFICFLMRAYDPLSPPYDRIGKMFGLTNLTQNRDGLLRSDWYTDEVRRIQGDPPKQGKTYKKPPTWYIKIDEYCDELDRNFENDE